MKEVMELTNSVLHSLSSSIYTSKPGSDQAPRHAVECQREGLIAWKGLIHDSFSWFSRY
jgi:hypothetical protein